MIEETQFENNLANLRRLLHRSQLGQCSVLFMLCTAPSYSEIFFDTLKFFVEMHD